jgi:universal stress protein A
VSDIGVRWRNLCGAREGLKRRIQRGRSFATLRIRHRVFVEAGGFDDWSDRAGCKTRRFFDISRRAERTAMLTIQRILCAVEMRLDDINVLASACALARPFRARVDTLLVRDGHEPPTSTTARPERPVELDTGREAELLFAELLASTPGSRVAETLDGGEPSAILQRSEECASDLIVLGLRHLYAIGPEQVGALADELSRRASCAVMTVPAITGAPAITRILLPVDFSVATGRAVEWAAELAQRFSAAVHVLHAVGSTALRATARGREPLRTTLERARGRLEEIEQRLRAATVSCDSSIAERGTAHAILACRTRLNSDLIIMGVHDHGRVREPAPGMVATIRCSAPVPVLSMSTPDSEGRLVLEEPNEGVNFNQGQAMGAGAAR